MDASRMDVSRGSDKDTRMSRGSERSSHSRELIVDEALLGTAKGYKSVMDELLDTARAEVRAHAIASPHVRARVKCTHKRTTSDTRAHGSARKRR